MRIMHKNEILKSKKSQNRIKELYNLYCKSPILKKKDNSQRISSAFSLKEGKIIIYTKNNFKIFKSNINLNVEPNYKSKRTNNELLFYNNSYWLKKLIKLKKSTCLYHYDKHFGSNDNCPICQKRLKKNVRKLKVSSQNEQSENIPIENIEIEVSVETHKNNQKEMINNDNINDNKNEGKAEIINQNEVIIKNEFIKNEDIKGKGSFTYR